MCHPHDTIYFIVRWRWFRKQVASSQVFSSEIYLYFYFYPVYSPGEKSIASATMVECLPAIAVAVKSDTTGVSISCKRSSESDSPPPLASISCHLLLLEFESGTGTCKDSRYFIGASFRDFIAKEWMKVKCQIFKTILSHFSSSSFCFSSITFLTQNKRKSLFPTNYLFLRNSNFFKISGL